MPGLSFRLALLAILTPATSPSCGPSLRSTQCFLQSLPVCFCSFSSFVSPHHSRPPAQLLPETQSLLCFPWPLLTQALLLTLAGPESSGILLHTVCWGQGYPTSDPQKLGCQ